VSVDQDVAMECSVLEVAGGGEAFLDLARAWHRRCLEDPVVSHVFSDPRQHPQHGQRLAAYCAEAHDGPTIYTDAMLRVHFGNGEHERLRSTLKSMSSQAYASKPIVERIRSSRARTRGQVLLAVTRVCT
jgi:hemoglobin